MRTLLLTGWLLLAAGTACCQAPAAGQEPSLRERAAAAENAGRFSEAADLWLQLVAGEPARVDWIVAAGRCLGRSSRFNDALDLLDTKRREMPGALDVTAMLARTLLLKAERDPGALAPELLYRDAAELAESILQADADHEDARLILAQVRYQQGDQEAAVAQAEEAARRHPHRPGAHVLRGRIAFDRFKQLLAQREQLRPEGAADAELVAAIDAQRQAATAAFTKAAGLDPTRAYPHLALGDLAARDGRTDAALRHYLDGMVADPDATLPIAWIDEKFGWEARSRAFAEAGERYRHRPDASPARAAALRWQQARAEFDGRQWQRARAGFEEVLRDNPAFTNAAYYAALAAFSLDDHDGAEQHAAWLAAAGAQPFADTLRALAAGPRGDVAAMLKFLADRAFAAGRLDHSRDLNHVIACLRDSADAWNNWAFLCRETGRHEQSLEGYLLALEREPDSPQLLNDTGVVLQYHLTSPENLVKARDYYERALRAAAAVLERRGIGDDERQRATQAQADARANLARLGK